jgi:hypothetical protein
MECKYSHWYEVQYQEWNELQLHFIELGPLDSGWTLASLMYLFNAQNKYLAWLNKTVHDIETSHDD